MVARQETLFDAKPYRTEASVIPDILGVPVNTRWTRPMLLRVVLGRRTPAVYTGYNLWARRITGTAMISTSVHDPNSPFFYDEQYDDRSVSWRPVTDPVEIYIDGFLLGFPYMNPRHGGERFLGIHLCSQWDDIGLEERVIALNGIDGLFKYPDPYALALAGEDNKAANGEIYRGMVEVRKDLGPVACEPKEIY